MTDLALCVEQCNCFRKMTIIRQPWTPENSMAQYVSSVQFISFLNWPRKLFGTNSLMRLPTSEPKNMHNTERLCESAWNFVHLLSLAVFQPSSFQLLVFFFLLCFFIGCFSLCFFCPVHFLCELPGLLLPSCFTVTQKKRMFDLSLFPCRRQVKRAQRNPISNPYSLDFSAVIPSQGFSFIWGSLLYVALSKSTTHRRHLSSSLPLFTTSKISPVCKVAVCCNQQSTLDEREKCAITPLDDRILMTNAISHRSGFPMFWWCARLQSRNSFQPRFHDFLQACIPIEVDFLEACIRCGACWWDAFGTHNFLPVPDRW